MLDRTKNPDLASENRYYTPFLLPQAYAFVINPHERSFLTRVAGLGGMSTQAVEAEEANEKHVWFRPGRHAYLITSACGTQVQSKLWQVSGDGSLEVLYLNRGAGSRRSVTRWTCAAILSLRLQLISRSVPKDSLRRG